MAFEVGKRVVAESESTGRRPRSGVVEEVLRCPGDLVVVASQIGGVQANRVATPVSEGGDCERVDAVAELGTGEEYSLVVADDRDADPGDLGLAKPDDGGAPYTHAARKELHHRRRLQVGLECAAIVQ